MMGLRAVFAELFSLFVDDVSFSVAIIIWCAVATLALPHALSAPQYAGILLFIGCAVILAVSTWSAAKKAAKR